MIRVALLLSALVHAHAHVYERCELARELTSLGVHRDHLATWVCIAFHESRFDTSARNHGSGDHGLFQISELYWCGPGKACGVPCTAFRDEDISDDLECALKIHKEHTVLQGDGYLAWVVYPHHCKNINGKKYLADCEASLKNVTVNPDFRYRGQKSYSQTTTQKPFDANYYAKNLPSFLAINSIFENNQVKQFEGDSEKIDWVNFKFDNIDNIKLPKVSKDTIIKYVTPASTTTPRENYDDSYPKPNYKNDWVNYKLDNIDNLKLPAKSTANQNNGLPSWLNIKIDSGIDDLKLPAVVNNAVKHIPITTTPIYTNYDENIPRQNYKNDWVNLRIDNIDYLQLPVFPKTQGSRKNNGLNWLNVKINNRIDDIDLDKLVEKVNVENVVPVQLTTSTVRTTTIDPELIGIKPPMPRRIESNQFRRRMMNLMNAMLTMQNIAEAESPNKIVTEPSSILNKIPSEVLKTIPKPARYPVYTEIKRNKVVTESPSSTASVFSFRWNSPARSESTTEKNVPQQSTTPIVITQKENVNSVTEKNNKIDVTTKTSIMTTKKSPLFEYRFNDEVSEPIKNIPQSHEDNIATSRLPSYTKEPSKTTTTTAKPSFVYSSTTLKPETLSSDGRFSFDWNKQFQNRFTFKPFTFSTAKPSGPEFSSTLGPYKALEELNNVTQTTVSSTTTTVRPWSWYNPKWTLPPFNSYKTSVTISNFTGSSVSSTPRPGIQRQRWSFGSLSSDFNKQPSSSPQHTIVQSTATSTTAKPIVTQSTPKPEQKNEHLDLKSAFTQNITLKLAEVVAPKAFTFKPFTTTVKPEPSSAQPKVELKSTVTSDSAIKTTPSIFDLYLRPEKFSTVKQYQFPTFKPSGNKLTIFSGGTTPRTSLFVPVKP